MYVKQQETKDNSNCNKEWTKIFSNIRGTCIAKDKPIGNSWDNSVKD